MLRTPERSNREDERNRRQVDWKFWVPIASALVGGASLIAGTFVSSTCTKYGPGENGCTEYGFDLLGRGITVAGLILLVAGLYVIFAPHISWPLAPGNRSRRSADAGRSCGRTFKGRFLAGVRGCNPYYHVRN